MPLLSQHQPPHRRPTLPLNLATASSPAPSPDGATVVVAPPAHAAAAHVPGTAVDATPIGLSSVPRRGNHEETTASSKHQPRVRGALISGVVDLFPDVREDHVAELVREHGDGDVVCNLLLENPTHPTTAASVRRELGRRRAEEREEGFLLALRLNEDEYEREGQLIGCGCCYGEFAFEAMTQCSDGHLFCRECLVRYAREAVFGAGRSELSCMEGGGGCPCPYPACELERVLPGNVLSKYHERQAEEAVAAAACGDELVRCPACDFPALLDAGALRFGCPDPRCLEESCRRCRVRWTEDHAGKTCGQVAETDEIGTRVRFEERMTEVRVRRCAACRAGLVKAEGCNHVTCRCGRAMCYVCREPVGAGYGHFCRCRSAVQSSGRRCALCRKCPAFSDAAQDDARLIREIQKEGEAELSEKSPRGWRKQVGPPVADSAAPPPTTSRPRVEAGRPPGFPQVPYVPPGFPQVPYVRPGFPQVAPYVRRLGATWVLCLGKDRLTSTARGRGLGVRS